MLRRKSDIAVFEKLTFKEQEQAMKAAAREFREMLDTHLRRADAECRLTDQVLRTSLELLKDVIRDWQP